MHGFRRYVCVKSIKIHNVIHTLLQSSSWSIILGQLSNAEHASIPLGNHSKLRESGRRPKSGFVQKKTGRFGRKIKPPPPVKIMKPQEAPKFVCKRVVLPQIAIEYPKGYLEQ